MSLKLFRVTEFAESVFFTPQSQRRAVHPATVVLLACLWLASVGNLALWQLLWPTLFLSMPAGLTALPESGSPAWWPALQGVVRLMALSVTLVGAMLVPGHAGLLALDAQNRGYPAAVCRCLWHLHFVAATADG